MKKVLTIAGSDSGGGAGIQTDLKTFAALGVYGMTAITAVTAQNTQGVFMVENLSQQMVYEQIKAVMEDIGSDAVKIGMLSSTEVIKTISDSLREYKAKNIVLDPVMISTTGYRLIDERCIISLIEILFPQADIITPNIPEAQEILRILSVREKIPSCYESFKIQDEGQMEHAGVLLSNYTQKYVLIKGGHFQNHATDILCKANQIYKYPGIKIKTNNTHGTGCTLSSAIASYLALGDSMERAVGKAKEFIKGAIEHSISIGKGNGPTNPMYKLYEKEID